MGTEQFKREMSKAQTLGETDPALASYWRGYSHGLRRAYHGEDFRTVEEIGK